MKLGKACLQCRDSKRKCDRLTSSSSCLQCTRRKLHCSLLRTVVSNRPLSSFPSPTPVSQVTSRPSLPATVIEELCELYIKQIHDGPHGLFHEPTLRRDVARGTIPDTILYGIMGLSARFSTREEVRRQCTAFGDRAKRLVKADLENVCLANVQACILVGNICGGEANADSESIFFGAYHLRSEYSSFTRVCFFYFISQSDVLHVAIAMRMARLIHLGDDLRTGDSITRETNNRVWRSLYMIDKWSAAGLGIPRQFYSDSGDRKFAIPEAKFHHAQNSNALESITDDGPGFWAYMIILAEIFGRIQDLNHQLATEDLEENLIESSVESLAKSLDRFEQELPKDMQLTLENLAYHAEQGSSVPFVALHLGFHHYGTLLYFQYLDTLRPASISKTAYSKRCKHHAAAFSELLCMSHEQNAYAAVYYIVGHMTVVSSSVLVHTLLFGEEDELPLARQRLGSNFEILIKLRSYWPGLKLMVSAIVK
jgi:Fungal Zn(2)-Cys(6) binuclear cluster domain